LSASASSSAQTTASSLFNATTGTIMMNVINQRL
jgi:hypothetical protein